MDQETIFRLLAALVLVSAFTISGYYRRKADRLAGALDRSQGQGLLVVLRLLWLIVILPLLLYLLNPAWVTWARVALPIWARWLGASLALACLPMLFWVFHTIGENISPTQATRERHQLITHGPYRFVRHPLYTFGTLFFLSLAVMTGLWWLAAGLVVLSPLLLWRTPREEAQLIEAFGDEYRAYMHRTGRYLPKL